MEQTIDYHNFFQTRDGTSLYFEDHGQGDPVLLIPGLTGSTRTFQYLIPFLSKKYRVVTFDPRNYGRSSLALEGNTLIGQAWDVKDLIDFLKLDQVMLIGWSLGGGTVMVYSHLFGDCHLRAIGLMDSHLSMFSNEDWNEHPAGHFAITRFKKNLWSWVHGPEGRFANMASWANRDARHTRELFSEKDWQWICEDGEVLMPWAGAAIQYDYYVSNPLQYLENVSVPVLILSAQSYGEQLADMYLSQIKTYSELHRFDTGHLLCVKEPERVAMITAGFIEKILSMKSQPRP